MGRILFLLVTAEVCFMAVPVAAQPDAHGPQPPLFVNCPESLVVSCSDAVQYQFTAVHPHSQKPFARIMFRLLSGPGTIDSASGMWQCQSVDMPAAGGSSIVVAAEIRHGKKVLRSSREISLVTTGGVPSIQLSNGLNCGDTIRIEAGTPLTLAMTLSSAGSCGIGGYALGGVLVDQAPAGACTYGPDQSYPDCTSCYVLNFEPGVADAGMVHGFTWVVTDGSDTMTCNTFIDVLPKPVESADYAVRIGMADHVLEGQTVTIPVYLERADSAVLSNGFDMLIAYDSTTLSLQNIEPGSLINGCGWEYFSYESGTALCSDNCPGGLLRISGIADVNNGDAHPACEVPSALPSEMFSLTFLVTPGNSMQANFAPLRFFWRECGDNTFANKDGSLVLVSDTVYDANGAPIIGGTDSLSGFGGVSEVMATCLSNSLLRYLPAVDFYNGGVSIESAPVTDIRGDVNLNGIPYEGEDLQTFANYFKYGLTALGAQADLAQQASDINDNGTPLEMADFVSGQRVYAGQVNPDAIPSDTSVNLATFIHARFLKQVLLASTDTLAGVYLTFSGNLGTVTVARSGFSAQGVFDVATNITRVLVMTAAQESGGLVSYNPVINNGPLFSYTGMGTLTSIAAATRLGKPVRTAVQLSSPSALSGQNDVPVSFSLGQNIPNPFNPATTISFSLPEASVVTLEVFNIQGQKIGTIASGPYGAGDHVVTWDGSALASGMYLYRLEAGSFTATKKMLLLK